MADDELRFSTRIDTEGVDRGVRTLRGTLNRFLDSVTNTGRSINDAFSGSQPSNITRLNALIAQTELQIQQLQNQLDEMNNTGYTSSEFTQLSAQVERAQTAMENLLNEREALEESLRANMQDLGIEVSDESLQRLYESNTQWQRLSTEINQAEVSLSRYEAEMDSVARADSNVDVTQTEQYMRTETRLQSLIARLQGYREQLDRARTAEEGHSKSVKKATKNTKKFSKSTSKAAKSASKLSKAMDLLKASLGLSVVFMAFQAVVEGIKEGFDNLALYSDDFNDTLSSLVSSLTQLKNSIATAFAPLVTVAMPYITTFINGLSKALDVMAQFMSALTGSSTYTKATAVQEDYAASLEDTADAANEASSSLYSFDELNVANQVADTDTDSSSSEVDSTDMFTEGTIGTGIKNAVESFKELMADLFEPIQSSWDTYGQTVIDAFNIALSNIKELVTSIGQSFMEVWTNGTGEETVNNILLLLTTVLTILGSIAAAFTAAWNDNGTGTALIQSIFDALNSILSLLIVIGTTFASVWNNGTGQEICSLILIILTDIFTTITNIATAFQNAWQTDGTGEAIIQNISDLLIIVLSKIQEISSATSDWASSIDFSPLLGSIESVTSSLEPFTDTIGSGLSWLYTEVLLPLAAWTITDVIPTFLEGLSTVIDSLNGVITALEPLGAWLWDSFLEPLASWTGGAITSILQGIVDVLKSFSDWIAEHQEAVENMAIVIGSFVAAWKIVDVATTVYGIVAALAEFVATGGTAALAAGALEVAIGVLTSPITLVIVAIGSIITAIVLLVKNWDTVKETAADVWDKVCDIWNAAGDWFMENVADPVIDVFNWLWDGIKDIVNGIFSMIESFINGIISGINFMIDAINSISFDVPDWVPSIGGSTVGFSLPSLSDVSLPRLATGTVVPASSGEFAAILGDNKREPEVVSPLSTIEQAVENAMSRNKNSQEITIKFTGTLSELIRILKPELDKENSRAGTTLVTGV